MPDGRKTKARERVHLPNLKLDAQDNAPDKALTPVETFLKRSAEVTQKDHAEFSEYLKE
jgi:hypothetical protein